MVRLKKDLDELNKQKNQNSERTLELIKSVFLYPIKAKFEFEKAKNTDLEKTVKSLLWNATFEKQKIANLSFKEPYLRLSEIKNKSDFLSVRRVRDLNPRYLAVYTLSKRAH